MIDFSVFMVFETGFAVPAVMDSDLPEYQDSSVLAAVRKL